MKKFIFSDNLKENKLDNTLKYEIMDRIYQKKYKKVYFKRFVYSTVSLVFVFMILFIGNIFLNHDKKNKITIVFNLKKPGAETVKLVGDFNNWDTKGINLIKKDGYWKTELKVKEGSYRYFFVVDGKVVLDPDNPSIKDPFGDKVSMVNVYQENGVNKL